MIKGSGGLLSIMKLLREGFPCDMSDEREGRLVGKKAGKQDQMRKREVQSEKRHVRCAVRKLFDLLSLVTRIDKYYRRLNYIITPPSSCASVSLPAI